MARLVDSLADVWRKHGTALTTFLFRSGSDELMRKRIERSSEEAEQLFKEALLGRRDEISHPDPDRAISAIFRLLRATVSQSADFGRGRRAITQVDWNMLKDDLRRISSAYLRGNLEAQ